MKKFIKIQIVYYNYVVERSFWVIGYDWQINFHSVREVSKESSNLSIYFGHKLSGSNTAKPKSFFSSDIIVISEDAYQLNRFYISR